MVITVVLDRDHFVLPAHVEEIARITEVVERREFAFGSSATRSE